MSKAFDNSQIINGAPAPIDADKVDGLQASSFARTSLSNVSSTTILTKIKNVDGAGSGLDADLVRGLPADFTHYIAPNGYQKLPSGLIIQWGYTTQRKVTFPIAFPNAVLSAQATRGRVDGCNNEVPSEMSVYSVKLTEMYVYARQVGDTWYDRTYYGVLWMAIGY